MFNNKTFLKNGHYYESPVLLQAGDSFYAVSVSFSISANVGGLRCIGNFEIAAAAQALANRTTSSSDMPLSKAYAQPALNESPAPNVLTALTLNGSNDFNRSPFRP